MRRPLIIRATGVSLPSMAVTADDLDRRLGLPAGWAYEKSGVATRYHVSSERSSELGAQAALNALGTANLKKDDFDLLICTSGTQDQGIPCTAALIQKEMGLVDSGIPCFDINSTCISFLFGLDVAASLLFTQRYNRILLVSTEASSTAINWDHHESAVLIGDGAAAVLVEQGADTSAILDAHFETYSAGAHLVEFPGAGTFFMGDPEATSRQPKYQFTMDGPAVFKLVSRLVPQMLKQWQWPEGLTLRDADLVIPHQASLPALELLRRRLELTEEKYFLNLRTRGNMVAASIPFALHEAIEQGSLKRGNLVFLLGSSAGITVGGVLLRY